MVATGSPFEPVLFHGRKHIIGQCNNIFIFPGVGLGAIISEARQITNRMFLAAAQELAQFTCDRELRDNALYPRLGELREVSQRIAFKVAQIAREEKVCKGLDDAGLRARIEDFCWYPDYTNSKARS
jgi:malic enzyme